MESTPACLASFEVARFGFCPEGAKTFQPRATPGELEADAKMPALKGRNRRFDLRPYAVKGLDAIEAEDRSLLRPFRALSLGCFPGFPGRCPGLSCFGPFGATETRNFKTKHRGLLFPPPTSQTMGRVGELQGVAAVSSLVDRAGVAEGASPADLRRHLDPRRARFLVPLDHQRRVSLRTGFHTPGPFVHGEVVERQGRGVDFRLAAGDWRHQLHAASLGRLHVLVAAVEGVGQHRLWQQLDSVS